MDKSHLIACEACGREISRSSRACPYCGHAKGSMTAVCLIAVFGIAMLALFVALYIYCSCQCK